MNAPLPRDEAEFRSADARAADLAERLPRIVGRAKATLPRLAEVDAESIRGAEDLRSLPVLRKSEMSRLQAEKPPFGGLMPNPPQFYSHVFQSPGPIYEPGSLAGDWWRIGRFLRACGIGPDDIVQNCMSYHLTPAGMMFESGARSVGATVLPAGIGQSELQARAAAAAGVTAYAGTPDFLKVILDKGAELGLDLSRLSKAAVGGGALFPSLRAEYADRGIACLQNYATAEIGNIAYETVPDEGLVIDEDVAVEIVTPGTGDPVEEGRTGEVVVTLLNPESPLIRLATGDLSAFLPGDSACGRTNRRLAGWKGRADQAAKVKGMFIRPEQIAEFAKRHPEIRRVRAVISREGEMDVLDIVVEAASADAPALEGSAADLLKVRGRVEIRPEGTLPDDGKVIEDLRNYE